MTNNTFLFPTIYDKEYQRIFYKTNVARMITDMALQWKLTMWDTFKKDYRSAWVPAMYIRWTDIDIDYKEDTAEILTINRQFANWFYIDDFDKIQDNKDAATAYGKDNGVYLTNQLDADILNEVLTTSSVVDDWTLWGTAWNGITLTTSNVIDVISTAAYKLDSLSIPSDNRYAVVWPKLRQIIAQYVIGKDTNKADITLSNGFIGSALGFDFYTSNQLTGTASLYMATNPQNGDTVTIDGAVFTFVSSSVWVTPWNVLIGNDVDTTRASLAGLINAPTVTNTTQVALTNVSPTYYQRVFTNRITAVNSNSADTLVVTKRWAWKLVVSSALTATTDSWTTAKQIQHNLFGRKGWISLVIQKEPTIQYTQPPLKFGKYILNGMLYWIKQFADWAIQWVDVKLASSTF